MSEISATLPHPLEMFCPACGYDQHGIASPQCPECGTAIDRSPKDATPRIPWDRRLEGGRIKAFFRTIWWTIFYPYRLADERVRPVSLRDAQSFARVCRVILAMPCFVIIAVVILQTSGMILTPSERFSSRPLTDTQLTLWWELLVPWMAGAQILPLALVLPWFALRGHVGVLPWMLNRPSAAPIERARVTALSYYAVGPLALLPFTCAAMFLAVVIASETNLWQPSASLAVQTAAAIGAALIAVLPIILHYITSVRFYTRTTRGSVSRILRVMAIIPTLWLTNLLFWFGLVPWLAGLIWVLWRSL